MKSIRIPSQVLTVPALNKGNRAMRLILLCSTMAPADGIYFGGKGLARLKCGEALLSLDDLAKLWGCGRTHARRTIEAFESAGVVKIDDDIERTFVEGERQPRGRIIRVVYE